MPDVTRCETPRGEYIVSEESARLDVEAVHAFLTRSYWSPGISRAIVERAIANSLCFGLYAPDGSQVGFARLVTDHATFAYLCDVYVLEAHRGLGLGKALVRAVMAHPATHGLRRILLATRDAHDLYLQHGFVPLARPERFLEINRPTIYRAMAGSKQD